MLAWVLNLGFAASDTVAAAPSLADVEVVDVFVGGALALETFVGGPVALETFVGGAVEFEGR